jgi:hypothetical protein
MRPNNATELSHGIRQPDSNAHSHCTLERTNTFWPDDRVCRAGTGSSYNQSEVFDDGVWDCD